MAKRIFNCYGLAAKGGILLVLLLLHAFLVKSQDPMLKETDNPLRSGMDTLVQEAASTFMNDPSHVGLSIGIIKDGEIHTYNYGSTQRGTKVLPDSNTIYEIGSISKTFTGLLLAQAIIDRKINLQDDIRKYLVGSYPNLEYQGRPIKIIQLANHTSGLPSFLPDRPDIFKQTADSVPFLLADLHRNYTKGQFLKDLHNVKIDTVPGFNYHYSNAAAQLLGFILEGVYHKTYGELITRYISAPLKMGQTVAAVPVNRTALAKGYDAKGNNVPYMPVLMKASGGIYSSISDMLKYIGFQLNEKNEAVRLSHTLTRVYADGSHLGLYWRLDQTTKGMREIWHTGGTFGFSSYCVFYPEINTGLILLSNEFDPESEVKLVGIAEKLLKSFKDNGTK